MDIGETLRELGIDAAAHRVVGLLPLVYVAWADGKVQRAERELILRVARDLGWLEHGGEAVLERWLRERPTEAQLRAALALLDHLASARGDVADGYGADDLHLLLLLCRDVARAAGGFLGLGDPEHPDELRAYETIAAALDLDAAKRWRDVLAPAPPRQ